jgi:hypothetical protein
MKSCESTSSSEERISRAMYAMYGPARVNAGSSRLVVEVHPRPAASRSQIAKTRISNGPTTKVGRLINASAPNMAPASTAVCCFTAASAPSVIPPAVAISKAATPSVIETGSPSASS